MSSLGIGIRKLVLPLNERHMSRSDGFGTHFGLDWVSGSVGTGGISVTMPKVCCHWPLIW